MFRYPDKVAERVQRPHPKDRGSRVKVARPQRRVLLDDEQNNSVRSSFENKESKNQLRLSLYERQVYWSCASLSVDDSHDLLLNIS